MDETSLRSDPIGSLLEFEGDSAQIIPDPENGYDRVVPAPQLLAPLAAMYADAISQTDKDYEPIWKQMADNEDIYEGRSTPSATLTVPIAKRIANQQVAWTTTQILKQNPIITVKPLDAGKYTLPSEILSDGANPTFMTSDLSSEDAAKLYQSFVQFQLTEKIDFEQLIDDTIFSLHIGENPTFWRITYDPKTRYAKQRAVTRGDGTMTYAGIEETSMLDGDPVQIEHIYSKNVTMPLDETDEQKSPWLAEKTPLTNTDLWEGVKQGRYDFCLPQVDPEQVAKLTQDLLGLAERQHLSGLDAQVADIDKRVATKPTERHDVRTVWFFHPIKRTEQAVDESGQVTISEKIEMHSLCGLLHVKAKRFLALYRNPYWHGKRPYIPFFIRRRPHRFSGLSPVGDLAPIQNLISQIFHLQIQNAVQQNVKVFLIRNNSVTWRWMNNTGNVLRPGAKIPYDDKDDISPVQLGSQISSMASEITFLETEGERLTVTSDYDLGADIPNRTPAATVAQVQQIAKMQPVAILRAIRRKISAAIEMYLQTIAQYSQYQTIPFLDPEKRQLVQKLIAFPRDAIERHFSFHVTATGDEDSTQARIEKSSLELDKTIQQNAEAMKLLDIIMDPTVTPPAKEPIIRLLIRLERIYKDMLSAQRLDAGELAMTEDYIRKLAASIPPPPPPPETQPQGAPNAAQAQLPPAGAGGNVPALSAGPAGLGIPSGQPSDQGMAQSMPQGDFQPAVAAI